MILKRWLITLLVLIWGSASIAQMMCVDVFSEPAIRSKATVDSLYLQTIERWRSAWENNIGNRLFRGRYKETTHENFDIQNFHASRRFRSWFEKQNRMAFENLLRRKPGLTDIKYFASGEEAFKSKILAIRKAEYTIDMTYFILKADKAGLTVMKELKEAIRRGVSVRIMTDALGSAYDNPQTYLRSLIEFAQKEAGYRLDLNGQKTTERATLQVVNFNPVRAVPLNILRDVYRVVEDKLSPFFGGARVEGLGYSLNRRSHDKILLIDGAFNDKAISFIGGRNMSAEFYNLADHGIIDTEIMMKGLAISEVSKGPGIGIQTQEYFDQIYFHLGNAVTHRSLFGMIFGYKRQSEKMDKVASEVVNELKIDEDENLLRETLLEQGFVQQEVEVANTFHNIFRPNANRDVETREHRLAIKNSRSLITAITDAIKLEKEEITIVSPFIWFSKRQIRQLKFWLLQDRNRKLTIVTNSLMTSENFLTTVLVDRILGPELLLDKGLIRDETGDVVRRSVSDQVKIYLYGKEDSKSLGGTTDYGMLHMKAAHLKSSETSIVGTFNNDPRSLLLNSEGAAITRGSGIANQLRAQLDHIISQSHEWGGEEYHRLRHHPKLPGSKRLYAEKTDLFYDIVMTLKLWWML